MAADTNNPEIITPGEAAKHPEMDEEEEVKSLQMGHIWPKCESIYSQAKYKEPLERAT